jgi:hypothetical protein
MKAHVMPHADANGRSPQRFITLAADPAGRILITVYSYSGTNRRIISARKVSPGERKRYSKAKRGPVIAPAKGTNRPLYAADFHRNRCRPRNKRAGAHPAAARAKRVLGGRNYRPEADIGELSSSTNSWVRQPCRLKVQLQNPRRPPTVLRPLTLHPWSLRPKNT